MLKKITELKKVSGAYVFRYHKWTFVYVTRSKGNSTSCYARYLIDNKKRYDIKYV